MPLWRRRRRRSKGIRRGRRSMHRSGNARCRLRMRDISMRSGGVLRGGERGGDRLGARGGGRRARLRR